MKAIWLSNTHNTIFINRVEPLYIKPKLRIKPISVIRNHAGTKRTDDIHPDIDFIKFSYFREKEENLTKY